MGRLRTRVRNWPMPVTQPSTGFPLQRLARNNADSTASFAKFVQHLRFDLRVQVHPFVYEVIQEVRCLVACRLSIFGATEQQCRHPPALNAVAPCNLE